MQETRKCETRRAIVVEPHGSVRQLLVEHLRHRSSFDEVFEADTGLSALRHSSGATSVMVILDLKLPGMDGLELLRRLRAQSRDVRTLVYASSACELQVREILKQNPHGFVYKSESLAILQEAISVIQEGGIYLSPGVAPLAKVHRLDGATSLKLTSRERQILRLIAESYSSKQVASSLGVAIRTVENHRAHLMAKLGVHDVAALTRFAIREGLVDI